MSGLLEVINKYVRPYYYVIIVVILLVIFGYAGKYAYDRYMGRNDKKKNKGFKDVANANMRDDVVIIYLFHVDWCPHCKTALPEWKKFMNLYDGKEVNGNKIKCVELNCTDETAEVTKAIREYKIEGYPTVKMVKGDQVIDFDSKISSYTLEQFVETMA
jgi:thiol-disulfide isomerase/thioredoxin